MKIKKLIITLLCSLLIISSFSACSGQQKTSGEPSKAVSSQGKGSSIPDNSKDQDKDKDEDNAKASSSSRVFAPNELLSEEEASQIVGSKVTLDKSTLKVDSSTGVSNTYYEYKYSESTDISALFLLLQNKAVAAGGESSEKRYTGEMQMSGKYAESISGLGDKAFVHTLQEQINVLYGDYYFLVAFGGDDKQKAREINLNIAKKIIKNINNKR